MQEQSGWGTKPEENKASINEVLECTCQFFYRLEEVWGTRPNATIIVNAESSIAPLPIRSQSTKQEE